MSARKPKRKTKPRAYRLKLCERCAPIGWSLQGCNACVYVMQRPTRVKRGKR